MMSGTHAADEFDLTHLIKEALAIPEWRHEEVYFDPKKYQISFSKPLAVRQKSDYDDDDDDDNDDDARYKVGAIQALRIDEFAGLKLVNGGGLRNSNSVEVDIDSRFYDAFADIDKEVVRGRYYEHAVYIGWDDAVDRIADVLISLDISNGLAEYKTLEENRYCYHLMSLYEKIMKMADAVIKRKN